MGARAFLVRRSSPREARAVDRPTSSLACCTFLRFPPTDIAPEFARRSRERSSSATGGLFEVDIQEMPDMVRAIVEDPLVLGIHPAMSIVAKTKTERICVC